MHTEKEFGKVQIPILAPLTWNNIEIAPFKAFDTTGTFQTAYPRSFYYGDKVLGGLSLYNTTWAKLPIPVAVSRPRSDVTISQEIEDSIKVAIDELNRETRKQLGKDAFVFVSWAELNPQGNKWFGVSLKALSTDPGGYFKTLNGDGKNITQGEVVVPTAQLLKDRYGMKHELYHALGVGHTQRWFSIMSNNPGCGGCQNPSDMDAAHTALLYRVNELKVKYQTPFGLLEVLQGQRIRMMGLTREPIYRP